MPRALASALKALKHNGRPCHLKHLGCGLACEVKQTGLNKIRFDEHDWSQTSILHWLLVFVTLTSNTWPKTLISMQAQLFFYLSLSHQGVIYSWRNQGVWFVYLMMIVITLITGVTTAVRPKQTVFFCVATRSEDVSALSMLPGRILCHVFG